ncbi:zinc-ribbon domain-containing protein [Gemmatimonas sp.]|uniref:zinc-ribbon domain-containing protein n=1 Tax=Gemmatimonas sp. TaxID=1962908 RepID=UPI00286A4356|nr:zinc-ribbon domain-containing protein [Gemmatimonas sp.]
MTVSCPDCKSVFRVDPAKVPATGVRARCSVCGGVIAIGGGTLPVSVTPASSTAAVAPFGSSHARATPMSAVPAAAALPPTASVMTPPALAAVPAAYEPVGASMATTSTASPAATLTPLSSSAAGTPAAGKRPINPFLRADPAQRARRLARALVSDLVAYHPQKRDEGLRDGTLRQLFREEIKKSYEEYLEQVGRDVAEHSPYFQEALNEILAGGRRLF